MSERQRTSCVPKTNIWVNLNHPGHTQRTVEALRTIERASLGTSITGNERMAQELVRPSFAVLACHVFIEENDFDLTITRLENAFS